MKARGLAIVLVTAVLALAGCGAPAPAPTAAPAPAKPAATSPTAPAATAATKPTAAAKPAATAAPAPPKTPVAIRLGVGLSGEEQLWLMKAKPEITPNQGKWYTLEMTPFRANTDRFNAFQAGQIDGGTVAAYTAIFARGQGIPLKTLASITSIPLAKGQGFKDPFMVLSSSGITKVEDLRGKTIGIFDFKSATDMWARQALMKHGLNPDRDVQLAIVPAPNMGEALRSGKIDAGIFVQPTYAAEMKKGGLQEVFDTKEGVPFDEELLLLFFSDDFIKKNPDAVRAFLSDYRKATDYYLKNTADAKRALIQAKFVSVPEDLYLNLEDLYRRPDGVIDMASMEKIQDLIISAGWADKKIDMKELVDQSYLAAAP